MTTELSEMRIENWRGTTLMCVEGEPLDSTPKSVYCFIDCECGERAEMSVTVYGLLKNGNIEIKCRGCKKPLRHRLARDAGQLNGK